MSLTTQSFMQPGSVALTVAEFMRHGRVAPTEAVVDITLAAAADTVVLAQSDIPGANSYPAFTFPNFTTNGTIDKAILKSMPDSPVIVGAAIQDLFLGNADTTAVIIDTLFNILKMPLLQRENRDEVLITDVDGNEQRVYALPQITNAQTDGDLLGDTGAETFQYTFAIWRNQALEAVEVPAGDYAVGYPLFIQKRLEPRVLFDGSILAVDPAQMELNLERDEVRVRVDQLIEAGQNIDITGAAASTTVLLPSGQGFDLSQFTSSTEFDAYMPLDVFVGGQLATKGAVANYLPTGASPQPTSETWIEWVDASTVKASVDLWPGTLVKLIGPRVDPLAGGTTGPLPNTNTLGPAPLTDFLFGIQFDGGGNVNFSGVVVKGGNSVEFAINPTGVNETYLSPPDTGASVTGGTPNAIETVSMNVSTAELGEVTELRLVNNPLRGVGNPFGANWINFNSGGYEFDQMTALEVVEIAGSPGLQTVDTRSLPVSLRELRLNNNGINGNPSGTFATNWTGLAGLSALDLLDLSDNALPATAIDALLTVLNDPASSVTNAIVELGNNPGAAGYDLSPYTNLSGKSITVNL